ncbi:MAG: glycosyltransferase [Cyanobacteria bacterium J06597_16]
MVRAGERMTVGLVAHYLGARMGIGTYMDRLLPPLLAELASKGIDAVVVASPNALEQTPAIRALQVRSPHLVKVLPQLDYSPFKRFGWLATKFAGFCKAQGIDRILWFSNPMVLPWHVPSIAVLHDVNEWKAKEKYGSRLKTTLRAWMYLDASLAWAKKIICVSDATMKDLLYFRPDPEIQQKVRSIPNGLDSPLTEIEPAKIAVPEVPFLLSVGRIDPAGKRLPEAVALVEQLREQSGVPWELHLAGGMNSSTQAAGEAFLRSVEKLDWVHYHGYADDVNLAAWYRCATAVVFLSENEGFGIPVAEAASFGKRVIVNGKSEATQGAGGDAVIAVDTGDVAAGARVVLKQVDAEKESGAMAVSAEVYSYADAASVYAAEICEVMAVA